MNNLEFWRAPRNPCRRLDDARGQKVGWSVYAAWSISRSCIFL